MRLQVLLAVVVSLLVLHTASAQWNWVADQSFFNPNLDERLVQMGCRFPTDLSGDDFPEYVCARTSDDVTCLYLAEKDGEFPDIKWMLREGFFNGIEVDGSLGSVVMYDIMSNDFPELILDNYQREPHTFTPVIYTNTGSYDDPSWEVVEEDFFPKVETWGYSYPQVIDYDNDGNLDFFLSQFDDVCRYERDENNDWREIAFLDSGEIFDELIEYIHLTDIDNDGDYDILGSFEGGSGHLSTDILLNTGSADDEEWEWSVGLDNYFMMRPEAWDLNNDGYPEIIEGWKYVINTCNDDSLSFDRITAWAGLYITEFTALNDFDDDGSLDFIIGRSSYGFQPYISRMVQYQLSAAGWKDTKYFGDDYGWYYTMFDDQVLTSADIFNTGQPCFIASYAQSFDVECHVVLFRDMDDSDGFDWRRNESFFSTIVDTNSYYNQPALGDLDGDGVLDVVMLSSGERIYSRDSLAITFYKLALQGDRPNFIRQNDWGQGLEALRVRSLEIADLDNDGDCDLVCMQQTPDYTYLIKLFENCGNREHPSWRHVEDAFTNGGPDTVSLIKVADIDYDGKVDVIVIDKNGKSVVYQNSHAGGVIESSYFPVNIVLSAYPNPFNSSTTIYYTVGSNSNSPVRLSLFDLSGRLVQTLVHERLMPGNYRTTVNANGLSSGVYVVRLDPPQPPLERGEYSRKVVVVK